MLVGQAFNLEHALTMVTAQLVRRFPDVDPRVVHDVVRSCAAEYDGAKILTYVPVFVERDSVGRLASIAAEGPAMTESAVA